MYTLFNTYKISYAKYGAAQNVLVLLHGFCENKNMWNGIAENLKNEMCVLTIDIPGFGDSDFIVEANIETYAKAVRDVLLHEKINKCAIVGHSMGGYVALAFAEMFPDMVCGLGLFHSHPFEDDEIKKQNRSKAIELVAQYGTERYVRELFSGLFTETYKQQQPDTVKAFIDECAQTQSQSVIQALAAMRVRKYRTQVLKSFTRKCLIVIGREDSTIALDKSLEMALIPEVAYLQIFENCGHMGMLEHPKRTIDVIRNFITNIFE